MRFLLLLSLSALLPTAAQAQLLAFPEAEGFGQYATGARTNLSAASLYHVTNLDDSGPGSLRDALSQSNRFVVFDVGGIINLESVMTVASNITIAGQTAPGGITVYSDRVAFHNANNLISRHWAVRKGDPGIRDDAASIARGQNMIFDHMSITWGVDGTFDINPDSGYVIDDITIQNSIVAQGLDRLGHSTGGLMQPGGGVSVIKSLWADNVTRNPKVRNDNEFINNVVYGWESAAYIMGDTAGTSNANVVGNYFIEGPVNGSAPFSSGTSSFHIYADDNWVDDNRNGVLDGSLVTSYPGADVVASPHAFPTTAALTAQQAVQHVMANAGPHIVRDAVDSRLMAEVASYGTLGGVIQRETDLFPGFGSDPAYLNPRARLTDTDHDAIPDNWETANGLDPADPADWKGLRGDGYTALEGYLNELGADGGAVSASMGEWTAAANWAGATPTFADTATVGGTVVHSGGHAFARRVNVRGTLVMTGGTLDVFDTATSTGTLAVSGGTLSSGRLQVGASGSSGALVVGAGGVIQTGSIENGGGGASLLFDGGAFRAADDGGIAVATTLAAGGATFDTADHATVVTGAVSGVGGLTKQGSGSLTLASASAYSGPTLVEDGTLALPSGGIGASQTISVGANGVLDASAVAGGVSLGGGQSLDGAGTLVGAVTAGAGAVVRPQGVSGSGRPAVGIQAENMTLGSDWAVFDNAAHGTGAGGSYSGADLNDGGIVLVSGESLSSASVNGAASTTVAISEAGAWRLYAKVAEPTLSPIVGDPSTQPGGNNSFYTSVSPGSLAASPTNYTPVQTLDNNADVADWTLVSTSVTPASGVTGPLVAGIDYTLAAGSQPFAIYGREVGTVIDGFVLSPENLTAAELETVLSGQGLPTDDQVLTITGNYLHQSEATLAIDLDSADSLSRLRVEGTASLTGDLSVELTGGFLPQPQDVFEILTATSLTGQFANATAGERLSVVGGGSFIVDYDYANDLVTLSSYLESLPGDFNADGLVDAADYTTWRDGLGTTYSSADYAVWAANYGRSLAESPAGSRAPEPAAGVLASLLLTAAAARRRRP
ncbi:Autotransporter-associated beta strand repeat protein [Posidoniimonas polymericola]|uniref:Probable pectate lyase C n=1 Tax=Posidoniimonas polymericola TaxID=2528002 RepID=A0A5C5ZD33_9BACT|nr:autotransporter-associated beta strand repeat-containing protein [Posidoniimonas polymericola]TWT85319.1 Autotransporter-associated beta strand repeat protein [Posidoniimonas polymericola]